MKAPVRGSCLAIGIAALLLGSAAGAQIYRQDAAIDSLSTVMEELAWSAQADIPQLDTDLASDWWIPDTCRLDAGATPTARWCSIGAAESFWNLRAVRRAAVDESRTAGCASIMAKSGDVGAGNLSVQAASGLLIGAAGRAGPPSASGSLIAGCRDWRLYAGRPESRSFTGGAGTLRSGGWTLLLAGGERDRGGRRGGGGATRIVALTGRGGRLATTAAVVRDEGNTGWCLGADIRGEAAQLRAELAGWAPLAVTPPRLAWVVTAAARGVAFDVEGQLAGCDPGYAPPSGVRPRSLPNGGDRGWALRAQWHSGRTRCQAMAAASQASRRVDEFPATASTHRLELVLLGGDPRCLSWRGRLAGKSETVCGWSGRLPWLPPAEISSRRESRVSARLSGHAGSLDVKAAIGAAGVSKRHVDGTAESGWRTLVSLRAGGRLGSALEIELNQVWAWGAQVDLVSVEVPVAGFARPRHWGRRDGERSLGICWRGQTWRMSAAVSVWDVSGGGVAHEVLAGLHWGVR